jgi:23S rRNA (cytosine1962-C5)-methyltransferase
MIIETQGNSTNYQLLDSGNGFKLERFGNNTVIRPDSNCVWAKQLHESEWERAGARYFKDKASGQWTWQKKPNFKEPWLFTFHSPEFDKSIVCELRLSQSKNIGIFPEQAANWAWMSEIIRKVPHSPDVLNLFGYSGGATLCAASAGAQVCHVDASQAANNWAKRNQELSKLTNTPIRWIADDCKKFVAREIKREMKYDALIMDPPAFGRDQKGKIFEFEKDIYELLGLCKQVLKPKPLFVIFNGYSMGYSATVLKNLLLDFFPNQKIEFGELHLQERSDMRSMPCSLFARFKNN